MVINNEETKKYVSTIEGRLGNDRRIILRTFGTEIVISVIVEIDTEVICMECINGVLDVMKERGMVEK